MTSDDVSEVLKKFKDDITPEMERPKMRGKGADLFARRRQRMEKFIITEETRHQKIEHSASTNGVVDTNGSYQSQISNSKPPTPTTPNLSQTHSFNQPLPASSMLSGYCTDVEDDRSSFHRSMKVNYFSDCEDMGDFTYERKGRKGRPATRRAWETDVEDAYQSEAETPISTHYSLPSPSYAGIVPNMNRTGWESAPETPVYSPSSKTQHNMLPKSFATPSAPKRAWSRVSFSPKKTIPQRPKPQPTVQYPCAKTTVPTAIQPIKAKAPYVTKSLIFNPIIASKRVNTSRATNRPKTLPVSQILPKIDETPTKNNAISNHQPSAADGDKKQAPSIVLSSAPTHRPTPSHKSSATITITSRKNTQRQEQGRRILKSSENSAPDAPPEENRPESPYDNDDNKRPGSSASVASYVSSNSSMFTSTIPSRCLTPTNRSRTPIGVPKVLKIAGANQTSPYPTESSPTPFNTPTPLEQTITQPVDGQHLNVTEDNKSSADKKVSACLKVLDHTRPLSLPKSTTYHHTSPSPTLNAVLKQEIAGNSSQKIGASNRMDAEYTRADTTTFNRQQVHRSQAPVGNRTPQALGSIAEGMKGKGARMFEKQQKRMQSYTKETSKDSYPDLAYAHESNLPSNHHGSSSAVAFHPPGDVKMGMRDVVGEFQNCSQPGKAKRPSETKRRTRDPLHYQQQLTYYPQSVEDLTESLQSNYTDKSDNIPANFQMYPSANDFVQTPPSIPSPNDPRWTFGDDVKSTRSTSSVSSQKSQGPKTAPKPAKVVIKRQLSRESMKQFCSPSEIEGGQNLQPHPENPGDNDTTRKASSLNLQSPSCHELTETVRAKNDEDVMRDGSYLPTGKSITGEAPKPKFDGRKIGVHFEAWNP